MNKKLMMAAILSAALLTGCGGETPPDSTPASSVADAQQTPTPEETTPADPAETSAAESSAAETPAGIAYDYVLNGVSIAVGEEAAPIIAALGEPDSAPFEAPSCAFTGISYYYTYGGVQVVTYPDENDQSLNRIYEVDLQNSSVATNEGIKIGDTYDDVVAKYGTPHKESPAYAMYQDGQKAVQFFLEGDKITSIVYTIQLNG